METRTCAYVQSGRFFVFGLTDSTFGPIPFSHYCDAEGAPDGPVDMGAENLHESVKKALAESEDAVADKVDEEKMRLGAAELVDRARDGDQVAMATLQRIGENARAGEPRAKLAFMLCRSYIQAHPPTRVAGELPGRVTHQVRGLLGSVSQALTHEAPKQYSGALHTFLPGVLSLKTDPDHAAFIVADGPSLIGDSNERLTAILEEFKTDEEKHAFKHAVRNMGSKRLIASSKPEVRPALAIGYIVGMARRIQAIRLPDTSLSILSPMIAWELE